MIDINDVAKALGEAQHRIDELTKRLAEFEKVYNQHYHGLYSGSFMTFGPSETVKR